MAAVEVTALIVGLAPQYSSNVALPALITLAQAQLEPSAFGTSYDLACAYWVLHQLSGDPDGAAGAVTSIRNGDQAIGYAAPSGDDDLESSHWGKKLLGLMRTNIIGCRTGYI
jgi:hypothetical protein